MYDRSREQALASLLIFWTALPGLAAWAASSPRSHLWDQPWFLALATAAGLLGLIGFWALAALVWDKVPFWRIEIPDTYAQHIALKDMLAAARDYFSSSNDVPVDDIAMASYAWAVFELVKEALGEGEAKPLYEVASSLGDGYAIDLFLANDAAKALDALLARVDSTPIHRRFDSARWRERIVEGPGA